MSEEIAWVLLRIVYAALFLYSLKDLIVNFNGTVGLVKLVIPVLPQLFSVVMLVVMFFGGVAILFGIYAQIAGFFLLIYCLVGFVVHYRLAKTIESITLSVSASSKDKQRLNEAAALGVVGNKTSGQKNLVLAAVACFFMILGSGPLSITNNLF